MKALKYILKEFALWFPALLLVDFGWQLVTSEPLTIGHNLFHSAVVAAIASVGRWLVWGLGEK